VKLPAYKAGHLERHGRPSSSLTKWGILLEFHKNTIYACLRILSILSSPVFHYHYSTLRKIPRLETIDVSKKLISIT